MREWSMSQMSDPVGARRATSTVRTPRQFLESRTLKRPKISSDTRERREALDGMAINYDETINAFVEKIRSLKKENEMLRGDNLSYRNEIKNLRYETGIIKTNFEAIQDKVFKYKDHFLRAREECVDAINDLNIINNDRANLKDRMKAIQGSHEKEVGELTSNIEALKVEIEGLRNNNTEEAHETKLSELRNSNATLVSEVENLRVTMKEKNKYLDDIDKNNTHLRQQVIELEDMKSQKKQFNDKIDELEKACEVSRKEVSNLRSKLGDKSGKVEELSRSNTALHTELIQLQNKIDDIERRNRTKVSELAMKKGTLTHKTKELHQQKREQSNTAKESNALRERLKSSENKYKRQAADSEKLNSSFGEHIARLQKDALIKDQIIDQLKAEHKSQGYKEALITDLENQKFALKGELDRFKRSQNASDVEVRDLLDKVQIYEKNASEYKSKCEDLRKKLEEATRKNNEISSDCKRKEGDIVILKERFNRSVRDLENSEKDRQKQNKKFDSEKRLLEGSIVSQTEALKQNASENDQLSKTVSQLNNRICELNDHVENIMATNSNLLRSLDQERSNHKRTEMYLQAERLANTELADEYHSKKIVETGNETRSVLRQELQQKQQQNQHQQQKHQQQRFQPQQKQKQPKQDYALENLKLIQHPKGRVGHSIQNQLPRNTFLKSKPLGDLPNNAPHTQKLTRRLVAASETLPHPHQNSKKNTRFDARRRVIPPVKSQKRRQDLRKENGQESDKYNMYTVGGKDENDVVKTA